MSDKKMTKLVMARVDERLFARLRSEVTERRDRGECVHDADVVREALIRRYEFREQNQPARP